MENFNLKVLTQNCWGFYNDEQTKTGEIYAQSSEDWNFIVLDKTSDELTEADEEFLSSIFMDTYHV